MMKGGRHLPRVLGRRCYNPRGGWCRVVLVFPVFADLTMVIDEAGQIQYATAVSVHIWLPPGFPDQPPVVRPLVGVFHPNVSYEGVYLSAVWHPAETLLMLIRKIGDVLTFRVWDDQMVV